MKTKVKTFTTVSMDYLEISINKWIEDCSLEGKIIDIINISHSSFMFNRSSNLETYTAIVLYKIN